MSVTKTGSRARAGAVAPPKVGTTVAPPAGAHHWTLTRLSNRVVRNAETGKQRQQTVPERMRGDPGSDGVVADAWLASEFKPEHILARWGAARYRVDWYSAKNERVSGEVFEVLEPTKARTRVGGSRVAPQTDEGDEVQHATGQSSSGMPTDPWSLMMFMQQREEAAAERERGRAESQRERDREFYAQQQTQNTNMLQAMLQASARPAPAADASLAQRELAVSMAEMTLKLEKRLAVALEDLGSRGGGDDDDDDPPGSLEEAGSRIGMKLLGELEQKAPELLEEAIPRIASWLKSKGFASSTDLEDELAALRKRRAKKTGTSE